MNEDKKEYILQWFEKADYDIVMVHRAIGIAPPILDSACFHCQQAVEKYLKAYLVYQDKIIKKTHDLIALQELCSDFDPDFDRIDVKDLDNFSVDIRYPDDAVVPSLEEAKEYLQITEEIKELVRKKIIF